MDQKVASQLSIFLFDEFPGEIEEGSLKAKLGSFCLFFAKFMAKGKIGGEFSLNAHCSWKHFINVSGQFIIACSVRIDKN